DALRFTLATGGAAGYDFRLYDEKLEAGRNFANKIWNAARFVVQSIGKESVRLPDQRPAHDQPVEDRWIVSRANAVAREPNRLLGEFQINEAGQLLYEFFWGEYCDWYLEMAKVRLKDGPSGKDSPLPVLADVLQTSLRLLHPLMPFVTEAAWQYLRGAVKGLAPDSIMVAAYPSGEGELDVEAEGQIRVVMDVVRAIRNIRAERGVDPARYAETYVSADGARPVLEAARPLVETLARARPLHILSPNEELPKSGVASAVLRDAQVALPLAALLDVHAERTRLSAQLAEAEAEVRRLEGKLAGGGPHACRGSASEAGGARLSSGWRGLRIRYGG
ncbi:MAG: valine--tRNA ligase, partial [Chloroflexi bacterium]